MVTLPPGVVSITSTTPALCNGVITVTDVELFTTIEDPDVPPKVIPVVPVRFVPVIVVDVLPEVDPLVVLNDVIVGELK